MFLTLRMDFLISRIQIRFLWHLISTHCLNVYPTSEYCPSSFRGAQSKQKLASLKLKDLFRSSKLSKTRGFQSVIFDIPVVSIIDRKTVYHSDVPLSTPSPSGVQNFLSASTFLILYNPEYTLPYCLRRTPTAHHVCSTLFVKHTQTFDLYGLIFIWTWFENNISVFILWLLLVYLYLAHCRWKYVIL
jgi:hypothetical protein